MNQERGSFFPPGFYSLIDISLIDKNLWHEWKNYRKCVCFVSSKKIKQNTASSFGNIS